MQKKISLILAIAVFLCFSFSMYETNVNAQTIYFQDDFSGGSSNWTANAGTWTVESGEYSSSSTDTNSRSTITNQVISDGIIEADLKSINSSGEWGGILFRKSNISDGYGNGGYLLFCRPNGEVTLYKGSTGTYLASVNTGISFYNTFIHVKIILNGASIKIYVNNEPTPVIDIADATYSSGYISLNACGSHWHFDNIKIQELLSPPKDLIAYKKMSNISSLYSTNFGSGASDWTANVGTWSVENGEYSQSSTSYYNANSTLTGRTFSDFIIEADLKSMQSNGDWGGIAFRKTSANDGYATGYLLYCTPNGTITIVKGGSTYVKSVNTGLDFSSGFIHIKLEAYGSSIKVFVNNEDMPRIDITDTTYVSGYLSLNACSSHWHFDNVNVTSFTYVNSLKWSPVTGAAGYNLYKRANTAADGHFESLKYIKVNSSPLTVTNYQLSYTDETYRVTALYSNGTESGGSDMVFPVEHYGAEPLSVQYLDSNSSTLKNIPVGNMTVRINVINSSADKSAIFQVKALNSDGTVFNTYSSSITLTGDGLLHSYNVQLTGLTSNVKSITARLYDASMNNLSTMYYFKPLGTSLMDTFYENGGTYLNKPEYDILHQTDFSSGASDWTANAGIWSVENGEYSQSSTYVYGANASVTGKTFSSCTIEADLKAMNSSGEWGGINFGKVNPNDDYTASGYLLTCSVNGTLTLYKNGTIYLGSANTNISFYNTFVHVKIQRTASDILIYINGENTPRITAADNTYTSGYLSLNACANHWHFDNVKIQSITNTYAGTLDFNLSGGPPQWTVACWHTMWNWIRSGVTDPAVTLPDGSVTYNNQARSITRSSNGTLLTIKSKGSVEYNSTRQSTEPWPHLLLEITRDKWPGYPNKITISDANSLIYTADVRMVECENKTAGYDAGLHAGQYVMYFSIGGKNGENMWFSLSGLDSRVLEDQGRVYDMSYMLDVGTSTFIIALPHKEFWSGHIADGQWHTLSVDLKPLIEEAYNIGKTIGAFATSNFSDLYISSTNSGFELPGTFDMEFQTKNFQFVKN